MKTNYTNIDPSRLNFPLAPLAAGRLSSAVLVIGGDIPDDIAGVAVQIERVQQQGEDRPNFNAGATRQADGTFRCYLSPFCFPDATDALHYHVMGTDERGNPRWLGSGALRVLGESTADGSPVSPDIIPSDTFVRNPVTGLYHKLVAEVNDLGELTVSAEQEGVAR